MTDASELERIRINTQGEPSPPVQVRLRCSTDGEPHAVLTRVREVMELIASERMAEPWPDDSCWRGRLPGWFLHSFAGHSIEDMLQDASLWDFGSWLDAMRRPGWEWWSSVVDVRNCSIVIRVCAYSDPYSIEPLQYLCRVAGSVTVSVVEGTDERNPPQGL